MVEILLNKIKGKKKTQKLQRSQRWDHIKSLNFYMNKNTISEIKRQVRRNQVKNMCNAYNKGLTTVNYCISEEFLLTNKKKKRKRQH